MDLFQVSSLDGLGKAHRDWVDEAMANGSPFKDDLWTESVAVGDGDFVEEVKDRLGARAKGRAIIKDGDQFLLREKQGVYLEDMGDVGAESSEEGVKER